MTKAIRLERANGIATIILDRPEKLNAVDASMMRRMTGMFEMFAGESGIRLVVIRAIGKHFSAGGDIGDLASIARSAPAERAARMRQGVQDLCKPLALALDAVPQPVLACVRGHVIGVALQLVTMCDLVVASETARFTMPQVMLGHTPDHGESWTLVRRIGLSRALQMVLTGDRVDARDAERFGLVNWVTMDGELESFSDALIARLAANAPEASRLAKALFRGCGNEDLAAAIDAEADAAGQAGATDAFVQAVEAFAARRK